MDLVGEREGEQSLLGRIGQIRQQKVSERCMTLRRVRP